MGCEDLGEKKKEVRKIDASLPNRYLNNLRLLENQREIMDHLRCSYFVWKWSLAR